MAVAIDATGTEVVTPGGSFTCSYNALTSTASANAIILLVAFGGTGVLTPTAVWDAAGANQSMTLVASVVGSSIANLAIFGLIAPSSFGNKTITISWTNAGSGNYAVALSLTGVNQTSTAAAFKNSVSSSASTTTNSVVVTSAVGDMTFALHSADTFTPTLTSVNGTQIFIDNTSFAAGANYATGAATVTLTSNWSASSLVYSLGIDVAGSAGADTLFPQSWG